MAHPSRTDAGAAAAAISTPPASRRVPCEAHILPARPVDPDLSGELRAFLRDPPSPRERLRRLLEALDRELDAGPRVEEDARGRSVWVFGAAGYRFDRVERRIYALSATRGEYCALLELRPPLLVRSHPVLELLRHLGLGYGTGGKTGTDRWRRARESADRAIVRVAWNRLRRDPRFRELRESRLPAALGLEPDLLAIALRAHCWSGAPWVPSDLYARVWRHAEAFRRLDRENPRLAALAVAAVEASAFGPSSLLPRDADLCKLLHDDLRRRGISAAAWRRVAREGDRLFRGAWRACGAWGTVPLNRRYETAADWLRVLQQGGLPPTPPPVVARDVFQACVRDHPRIEDGRLIGDLLREARCRRGQPDFLQFVDEMRAVLRWARHAPPRRDARQRSAGWSWLVARAEEWERTEAIREANGVDTWPMPLPAHRDGAYLFEPVGDVETLCAEAAAMRNCLRDLARGCAIGMHVLYVIRDARSGRRLAHVRLEPHVLDPCWCVMEVAGFANRPVAEPVAAAAARLAARLPLPAGSRWTDWQLASDMPYADCLGVLD